MRTFGILANCDKPTAPETLRRIERKAAALGLRLVVCGRAGQHVPSAETVPEEAIGHSADALMVLGGDGTMLRAVRVLQGAQTPIIGVNLGSLGFLASVTQEKVEDALDCIVEGRCSIQERAVADGIVMRDGREISRYRAVNDMVIDRGASSRIVSLHLTIDEAEVIDSQCDCLILATPTGSTGHNLSAGGPVIHPASAVFVITLICPHALSVRPIVVPDSRRIAVDIARCSGDIRLAVDGQTGEALRAGDRIEFSRSGAGARFIMLPGSNYFSILRQKLHLRGSSV